MKIELCAFSGSKIYPGHGLTKVRADGRIVQLLAGKSAHHFEANTNPRRVRWTVMCRRRLRKGVSTVIVKEARTKKNTNFIRAVGNLTAEEVAAKKAQSDLVRAATREAFKAQVEAIKTAKRNPVPAKKLSNKK